MGKNYCFKLGQLVLFVVLAELCLGDQKVYYMDAYKRAYGQTVQLQYTTSPYSAITVKASKNKYPDDGVYALTILPPEESNKYYIRATVRKFELRSEFFECLDNLTITMEPTVWHPFPRDNRTIYTGCSSSIPKSFLLDPLQRYGKIHLELKLKRSRPSNELKGFQIIFTTLRSPLGDSCNDKEFTCSNEFCINKELTCNDRDNCGDDSDESVRACKHGLTIGLSVGGAVIFIIIVAVAFAFYRRSRRQTTTRTVIIPPQNTPIYPGNQSTSVYPVAPGPGALPYKPTPYGQQPAYGQQAAYGQQPGYGQQPPYGQPSAYAQQPAYNS